MQYLRANLLTKSANIGLKLSFKKHFFYLSFLISRAIDNSCLFLMKECSNKLKDELRAANEAGLKAKYLEDLFL